MFAISLPFALIEGEKAAAVFKIVEEKLYTPVGLTSLPKKMFIIFIIMVEINGTVIRLIMKELCGVGCWVPMLMLMLKSENVIARADVKKVIDDFKYHLNEACIGQVSEIFDADTPHHPRGCVAQAWGVAEILRVMKEHELYDKKTPKAILKSTTTLQS